MVELNIAGIRRLAKKAGIPRISLEALEYLLNITEYLVMIISSKAHEISVKSGRKKVEKGDIAKALNSLRLDNLINMYLEKERES